MLAFASDVAFSESPYAQIGARGVFGLSQSALPATPTIQSEPLPKITPNGIISIFGNAQTLFKIADNQPGRPALEKSYILAEGQFEGDVEVIKIDAKNAVVTFNNHGTIQIIPLAVAKISSGLETGSGNNPQTASAAFNPNRFMGPAGVELRSQRIENQNLSGLGGGYAASPSQEKISNQGVDDSQGAGNFSAADNSPFRKPRDWAARNLASEQMVFSARERM